MAGAGVITLVDDTAIAFDDIGSGLPVVFLHAFPLNRTMWEPQIGALVAECRCIPIDFRGFGDSRIAPPFTVDRYADDWSELRWVQLLGEITVIDGPPFGEVLGALADRYPQYRADPPPGPVLRLAIARAVWWRAVA